MIIKILDKFSHKFNKGFYDYTNIEDNIILKEILTGYDVPINELEISKEDHWEQRLKERTNIISILNIKEFSLSGYDINNVENKLKGYIKDIVIERATRLENVSVISKSSIEIVIYKIAEFNFIDSEGKKHKLLLKCQDTDSMGQKKYSQGFYYYVPITNNRLYTIILSSKSDSELKSQVEKHSIIKKRDISDYEIREYNNFSQVISIQRLMGEPENKLSTELIPYELRTDYRKGAILKHKDWGNGVIITTSNGNRGIGDANGKLNWILVDFTDKKIGGKDKERLSAGKIIKTRQINNVYTKKHFDSE